MGGGGVDLTNLAARIREQEDQLKTMRWREMGARDGLVGQGGKRKTYSQNRN